LTMCLRGDLIRPHKQDTPQTEPSKALTKHIKNVKDQTLALYTTSLSVYLSIHLLYRTISIYFYALSLAMRFSLLIALWDLFSFVVFSEGKGYGRWESNPQRRCLLIGAAPSLVACVATFDAIRAAAGLLARGAYPFALSLQCFHRRGLTGFRLRVAHFTGVPSGLGWRCVQSYPLRIISVTNTSPSRQSALCRWGSSYRRPRLRGLLVMSQYE
jgi:hypothetical protein